MKICATALLVIGLLNVPAFAAPPAASPPKAYRIKVVERHNQILIERGSSIFHVRQALGEPRRRLNSNLWAYDRFEACDARIETGDCTTLLVVFIEGKVVELKLINGHAEKVIAASLEAATAERGMVATK